MSTLYFAVQRYDGPDELSMRYWYFAASIGEQAYFLGERDPEDHKSRLRIRLETFDHRQRATKRHKWVPTPGMPFYSHRRHDYGRDGHALTAEEAMSAENMPSDVRGEVLALVMSCIRFHAPPSYEEEQAKYREDAIRRAEERRLLK